MSETPASLGARYGVDIGSLVFAPNADVCPTTINPVIRCGEGARAAELMRWGLVPPSTGEPKAKNARFNARAETAPDTPLFRGPFRSRRCLVPASAFYEWKANPDSRRKTKYRIARRDGDLVTMAGLFDVWRGAESEIHSYVILTTEPNALIAEIHPRMPVILGESEWGEWLAPETTRDTLKAMCMPCPSEWLTASLT